MNFFSDQQIGIVTFGNFLSLAVLTCVIFALSQPKIIPQKFLKPLSFLSLLIVVSALSLLFNGTLNIINVVVGVAFSLISLIFFTKISVRFTTILTVVIILTPLALWWVSFLMFAALGVFILMKIRKVAGGDYAQFLVYETFSALVSTNGIPTVIGSKGNLKRLPFPENNKTYTPLNDDTGTKSGVGGEDGDVRGEADKTAQMPSDGLQEANTMQINPGKFLAISYIFVLLVLVTVGVLIF